MISTILSPPPQLRLATGRRSSPTVSSHLLERRVLKTSRAPSSLSPASRRVLLTGAAASLFLWGRQGEAKALGPGGPQLEEEFWENMRRYALYALTVSTGGAYAVIKPFIDLLRNPLSALLLLAILVGGGYLLSQVLSLMIGVTDFSYDYAN